MMLTYQNNLLKLNKPYPIDYVIHIPKEIMQNVYQSKGLTLATFKRMAIVKNVIFRRILEIRLMKAKPKLSDLIKKYLPKDDPIEVAKMNADEL